MLLELESVVLEHDLPEHDLCPGDLGAVVHLAIRPQLTIVT